MNDVTRVCWTCRERKPFPSAFSHDRKAASGYGRCKQCDCEQAMWSFYRVRWWDYRAMRAAQFGMCPICIKPLSEVRREVVIDHKHDCDHPGKGVFCCRDCVRGLLCQRCNTTVLGVIENDEVMGAAIRYLGEQGAAIVSRLIDAVFAD